MSLGLDKTNWKRVALGDVVRHVTDRVDAATSGLKRFLAGEHIPSRSLHISDWGVIGQDPIGPMFYKRFKPGHVLYVSRRSYLRKTAVPDFEGICGEKTFVFETQNSELLLQDFLPFLLSSESFHRHAVTMSRGSVNPYVNWTDLRRHQFALPTISEQRELAKLLWSVENESRASDALIQSARRSVYSLIDAEISTTRTRPLSDWIMRIEAGRSPRAASEPAGAGEFGVLKVSALQSAGFQADENKRLIEPSDFRVNDSIKAGDLIVTRANASVDNVVRPCLTVDEYPNLMLSDKTLRLVPVSSIPSRVVVAALESAAYRKHVREFVGGTEAKNISQKNILSGPVPRWPSSEIRRIDRTLVGSDEKVAACLARSGAVASLRSALSRDIFGSV